ncbi:alcohol dehydrogenase catalytic domain-containing protein [Streptomyces sp. XM83C]|uniref:alcohol dehydrogenase catalytic domain-containing protein n=2 Tax=Streptomyces TaxID=1883 RepID=UPI001FF94596|nr:alcohol dehydrogenase catalytic domain-containing protein [Streptomyces sp. XM83C]
MMAALITGRGSVDMVCMDDPAPGPRDVVVAVAACGLCPTDRMLLGGDLAPELPLVPGHEFAGEVVAVGRDVTEPTVGDRVAVDPVLNCGTCRSCRRGGRGRRCERVGVIGVTAPGGAAEFAVVPAANCVLLPEHVSAYDATLIEPLSRALRASRALRRRPPGKGAPAHGEGAVGLMVRELARNANSLGLTEPMQPSGISDGDAFVRAVELFSRGVLDPDDFIGDRLPLSSCAEALRNLPTGGAARSRCSPP